MDPVTALTLEGAVGMLHDLVTKFREMEKTGGVPDLQSLLKKAEELGFKFDGKVSSTGFAELQVDGAFEFQGIKVVSMVTTFRLGH